MMRRLWGVLAACALLGASAAQLDSQYVLQRYTLALETEPTPKAVIFDYSVSQVGPSNMDERHTIYRSGLDVRDETISLDGNALHRKVVRILHHADRYAVQAIAPRSDDYELLFVGTSKDGHHVDYTYEATPLLKTATTAAVERVTVDGIKFLPRTIVFRTGEASVRGNGRIEYAQFGKYWMPVSASIVAVVDGKPARERITWSAYRFPGSLPASTFVAPKPLPRPTLPVL